MVGYIVSVDKHKGGNSMDERMIKFQKEIMAMPDAWHYKEDVLYLFQKIEAQATEILLLKNSNDMPFEAFKKKNN